MPLFLHLKKEKVFSQKIVSHEIKNVLNIGEWGDGIIKMKKKTLKNTEPLYMAYRPTGVAGDSRILEIFLISPLQGDPTKIFYSYC